MTGNPNKPLPTNWNDIPGAKGCTPQTCSIRDNYDDFTNQDIEVFGISYDNSETHQQFIQKYKRTNINNKFAANILNYL